MIRKISLVILLSLLALPMKSYAQNSFSDRYQKFQALIEKKKTPEDKIKKAEALAKDAQSPFRIDAINYLTEQKSPSSGSVMVELMNDPDVREFAVYSVGEFQMYEATPQLIGYLKDENQNVRGNSFHALQRMYPKDFNFKYHYDDAPYVRDRVVLKIDKWWELNQSRFKAQNPANPDKTAATSSVPTPK